MAGDDVPLFEGFGAHGRLYYVPVYGACPLLNAPFRGKKMKISVTLWVLLSAILAARPAVAAEVPAAAHSEQPADKDESAGARNALSVDLFLPVMIPISLAAGEKSVTIPVNIKYQRAIGEHLTLAFKAGLNYGWPIGDEAKAHPHEWSLDIYPTAEIDWHPFDSGLDGFHVGLSAFFNYSRSSNTTEVIGTTEAEGTSHSYRLAVGPILGWQFALPANIILEPSIGFGYGYNIEVDVQGKETSSWSFDVTEVGIFVGRRF